MAPWRWSIFLFFTSTTATILTKTSIQNSGPLCLDGTTPTYYQRTLSGSTRWVIYVEDGPPSCIGDETTCTKDIKRFPYFITSQDEYHPKTINSTTFLSDDPNVSPWPLSNLIYLNYCSMDGWLGSLYSSMYDGGYHFRGSINFKFALTQILGSKAFPVAKRFKNNPSAPAEIVLIGSGVGAMGITFHLPWLLNVMGFSVHQLRVIHDSFMIPTSTIPITEGLFSILPLLVGSNPMTDTKWVNGYPCVWIYDCMISKGYIPSDLTILLLVSSYDPVLLAYSSSLSTDIKVERTFTSLVEFMSDYYAYGAATAESSISAYSSSISLSQTNTTIFIAGCLNHIYLMPITPRSRSISEAIDYTYNISVGNSLITILTTTSPSRYQSKSFSSSAAPYTSSLTLSEMISLWYSSNNGALVGNICSSYIRCDSVCSDEFISSPKLEYSSDSYLFNCLILGGFILFVLVVLVTSISILVDLIYWAAYGTAQIQPLDEGTPSESLFHLAYSLLEALITERERYFTECEQHREEKFTYMTHDDKYDIETIRSAMYDKYGKNIFIRHMAVSESSENNKLMSMIHSMDGHSAIFWLGLRYNVPFSLSAPPLTDSWGQFRFGRVTVVMGPTGSGKSTLMKVLSGQLHSGTIQGSVEKHLLLSCLEYTSERKQALSYIPQQDWHSFPSHQISTFYGILPSLSIERNLYYFASLSSTVPDHEQNRTAVRSTLERCGLLSVKQKLFSELTMLEQRKFSICLELVHNDPIMIVDEPFIGLDLSSSLEIMAIIKNEALMMGRGMVVVTRELGRELYPLVDDVLLMKDGKTLYYGHFHHFQQHILSQIETSSTFALNINPILTHLAQYSDISLPDHLASPLSQRSPSKYARSEEYYASLLVPELAERKETSPLVEKVDERSHLFTKNKIYNMFIEERREQMKEDRDRVVQREIERDRENRVGANSPSSPTRPSSLKLRGSTTFEKRKVEFDRLSDMMIQFCSSLPESSTTYSSLTPHLISPTLSTSLLLPSSLSPSTYSTQATVFSIVEHMNTLLSIHHTTSLQPYYTLSSNYFLGLTLTSTTTSIYIFISHLFSHIQQFLKSISWTVFVHFVTYIIIFYGLLFLTYSLREKFVSSLYISILYSVYIFYYTILLSLIWIPSLTTTYHQYLSNSSKTFSSFTAVLTYHLSTLSVCVYLSIILIIFLFSMMMYPLSLESEISLWVFYCGFMISVLYGMIVIASIWLLIGLFRGNLTMIYRVVSLFLLILPLSSGLLLNFAFLPNLYPLFLILNPIYIHFSLFTSLYLKDSCELSQQTDSIFNDKILCQNLIMTFFGFDFYGDQSGALILLFLWILFLNVLSLLILYFSTFRGSATYKSPKAVKELVHYPRDITFTEVKSPKKAEIEIPRVTSSPRVGHSTPMDHRKEEREIDSSLSSGDNRDDQGSTKVPEDHNGLNHDDLTLTISHPASVSQQSDTQENHQLTPLGLPLSDYQLTAEFPYLKVYQLVIPMQTDGESDEIDQSYMLSLLLSFHIPITKKHILVSVDEDMPFIDTLVIGVLRPSATLDEDEEKADDEEQEPDIFTIHLLQCIENSTLKTKFNKHQHTLHITAEVERVGSHPHGDLPRPQEKQESAREEKEGNEEEDELD